MVYLMTAGRSGDGVIMPLVSLVCSGLISLMWGMKWEKVRGCLARIRS